MRRAGGLRRANFRGMNWSNSGIAQRRFGSTAIIPEPGITIVSVQRKLPTLPNSLVLIRTMNLLVEVGLSTRDGRTTRRYRGKFDYEGIHYSLGLTDPIARGAFASKAEGGDYPLNDVYLCISLTEPYKEDGRCHKLVAAIISDPAVR